MFATLVILGTLKYFMINNLRLFVIAFFFFAISSRGAKYTTAFT